MMAKVTPKEILEMAIQMEDRGQSFYETAAQVVQEPGARELLTELAHDEVGHGDLFRSILARQDYESLARGKVPQDLRLSDYLVANDIGSGSTPQEILVVAIKMEQAAIDLYSTWLSLYRGTELETLITGLVQEEQRHKSRLEATYHDMFLEDW